jgi:hypothetical protein
MSISEKYSVMKYLNLWRLFKNDCTRGISKLDYFVKFGEHRVLSVANFIA